MENNDSIDTRIAQAPDRATKFETIEVARKSIANILTQKPELKAIIDQTSNPSTNYEWPVHPCVREKCTGSRHFIGQLMRGERTLPSGLVVCDTCGDYSTERIL